MWDSIKNVKQELESISRNYAMEKSHGDLPHKNMYMQPMRKPSKRYLHTVSAFPATPYSVKPFYVAAAPSLTFLWESFPSPQEPKCLSWYQKS